MQKCIKKSKPRTTPYLLSLPDSVIKSTAHARRLSSRPPSLWQTYDRARPQRTDRPATVSQSLGGGHSQIIWRAAFAEATKSRRSFIFTFNPEATVQPELIAELCDTVQTGGGTLHFVELTCSPEAVAARIGDERRKKFGKLIDRRLYAELRAAGAFVFPPLPAALLVINTEEVSPVIAAERIARALAAVENDA
jgi:hypothetical protein